MPRPVVNTVGLRKLQRDMRRMVPGSQLEVTKVVRSSVQPIAAAARRRTAAAGKVQTGQLRDSIRGTARGSRGSIRSRLPQAPVHEFGGTIAPRGVPIEIEKGNMVYGAIAEMRGEVETALMTGFERLARRNGW
jgi:hypothetical protein